MHISSGNFTRCSINKSIDNNLLEFLTNKEKKATKVTESGGYFLFSNQQSCILFKTLIVISSSVRSFHARLQI